MGRLREFKRTIYPDEDENGTVYRMIDFTSRYTNKYYNIFMGMVTFKGDAITPESENYLKRKFWKTGTVAAWKLQHTDLLGFAEYSIQEYNMWDYPAVVNLINRRKLPNEIIPSKPMVVNKDAVIGYFQANQKPVYNIVRDYAVQLSDIDNVMNTNLQLQKLPFIILCDDEKQAARMKRVLLQILNNDVAVEIPAGDKNSLMITPTASPFIIDKLYEYRTNIENELKTYLGLDNSGGYEKKERMVVDEVNSQRSTITDSSNNFDQCLDNFCKQIKQYLGLELSYEWNHRGDNDDINQTSVQLHVDGNPNDDQQ